MYSEYVNKLVKKSEPKSKGLRFSSSVFAIRNNENWMQCENINDNHAGKRFDKIVQTIDRKDSLSSESLKSVVKLVKSKHKVYCKTLCTMDDNVSILCIFPQNSNIPNEFMDISELGNIVIHIIHTILLIPPPQHHRNNSILSQILIFRYKNVSVYIYANNLLYMHRDEKAPKNVSTDIIKER